MFTVKLYQFGTDGSSRVTIEKTDRVEVLRSHKGDAELILVREGNGADVADFAVVRKISGEALLWTPDGVEQRYHRAIIENENGRTTEIVNPER